MSKAKIRGLDDTTTICFRHSMPKPVLFITKLFDITVILKAKKK